MRSFKHIAAWLLMFALLPALAWAQVDDQAGMFSAATVTQLNQRCDAVYNRYHKNVIVKTVTSIGSQRIDQAARDNGPRDINGVFVFVAKNEKSLGVFSSKALNVTFDSRRKDQIRDAIKAGFKSGDFDGGILAGMGQIESGFASAPAAAAPPLRTSTSAPTESRREGSGGFSLFSLLFWGLVIYLIYRVVRALTGGGTPPSGYGGGGYGPTGGGYGGSNYGGGGVAPPSGGGGFMSSFLGGAAGAAAGNYLYDKMTDHHGGSGYSGGDGGSSSSSYQASYDGGSQTDFDSGSTGSWGDSGGGGDWGGGGDSGGGGGDW